MKLLKKLLGFLALLIITIIVLIIALELTNEGFIKNHLPLPVKEETKQNLIEIKEYLNGNPLKIQRWLGNFIIGKSDGGIQYAQSPEETFERGTGDCEDYAIISKYFLEQRYKEIYIIGWTGEFLPESKYYKKGFFNWLYESNTIVHAICVFKIQEDVWGIMDNNKFIISGQTLEDVIRYDGMVRKVNIKKASIMEFNKYTWKTLRKLDLRK